MNITPKRGLWFPIGRNSGEFPFWGDLSETEIIWRGLDWTGRPEFLMRAARRIDRGIFYNSNRQPRGGP